MNRHASAVVGSLLIFLGVGCARQPETASPSMGLGDSGYQQAMPTAVARPDVTQYVATANLPDIHFDFDKYEIRPEAAKTLDASAAWLKSNAKAQVLIEGHCDERGTSEYNVVLGERRAKATMNYLMSRGIDARRIAVVSYGEDKPQCQQHNAACWAKNRRAHFLYKAE
jgi:peptidoglycan-associated lipoprotein